MLEKTSPNYCHADTAMHHRPRNGEEVSHAQRSSSIEEAWEDTRSHVH